MMADLSVIFLIDRSETLRPLFNLPDLLRLLLVFELFLHEQAHCHSKTHPPLLLIPPYKNQKKI